MTGLHATPWAPSRIWRSLPLWLTGTACPP
jgi:hypothetical protein